MLSSNGQLRCVLSTLSLLLPPLLLPGAALARSPVNIGERPALEYHVDQDDVYRRRLRLGHLMRLGKTIFDARFNALDGRGRPASTGTGEPRIADQPAFIRTSSPEASSCSSCHLQPGIGGSGDFVNNAFVGAQALDPVTFSIHPSESNERNPPGLFGAGVIEMLAREMSSELIAIREDAAAEAAATGFSASRDLRAKGISFGRITVLPDGRVDPRAIEGVDWDLIVKPFHQKGAVVSIRQFTNNAMNHHHGMQSVERFGWGADADEDGVSDELTVGDITAAVIFQASLRAPRTMPSPHPQRRRAALEGERVFARIGCGDCHVPTLELESRWFSEPNPYNPPGNLRPEDVPAPFEFDLVAASHSPSVRALRGGRARIAVFTDLKRHDLNDADYDHFANELVPDGTLAGFADPADFTVPDEPRPTREFLTRKLWDAGNSNPYGHRGDLSTLTEAIYFHGGEARTQRDAFFALGQRDRDAVIEFLKSMLMMAPR
jgi:hypothetical protein